MLKKICAALLLLTITIAANAQWTKTNGPDEAAGTAICQFNSRTYLGTGGAGLFSSADVTTGWTKNTAFPDSAANTKINKIITHYGMLYVSSYSRVYHSNDDGNSWQYDTTGLADSLYNILLYPANGMLYATGDYVNPVTLNTNSQLFLYNDFTHVWQPVANLPADSKVTSLAALHDTVYCAIPGHGIYRSNNYGFSWDSINASNGLGTNNARLLAVTGQKIYAVSYDAGPSLLWSANGRFWASAALGFTGGNIITALAANTDTVCLGSPGGAFISTDGGNNWKTTYMPYYSFNDIMFAGSRIMSADGASGLAYTDNDSTWIKENSGLNYATSYHLAMPYTKVYAMDAYTTFHTADQGNSWTGDTSLLAEMNGIAHMGNKLIGFLKYGQNDLYSYDQGQTWHVENSAGAGIMVKRSIVNNTSRKIYAWGSADVRRSDDYGKTWTSLFYSNAGSAHDTVFTSMARIKSRLFLTWNDPISKLFYSDDSGSHWRQIIAGSPVYHVATIADSVVLIGTAAGVMRSIDDGATFTTVYGGNLFDTYVNGNTIFSFTGPYANSINYSTDFGSTWTDISPAQDSVIAINDLVMDGTYVYAATSNRSIWRRALSDIGVTYIPDTSNNYIANVGISAIVNNIPAINVYPNPSSDAFSITMTLPVKQSIRIQLYDVTGRIIETISNSKYEAGYHTFSTHASLSPGLFYLVISADGNMITKKLVHL